MFALETKAHLGCISVAEIPEPEFHFSQPPPEALKNPDERLLVVRGPRLVDVDWPGDAPTKGSKTENTTKCFVSWMMYAPSVCALKVSLSSRTSF